METKRLLSLLWIFLTVNFIFCDVFTLMHSEDLKSLLNGKVGDIEVSQEFLLIFAVIMEIPMLMILLTKLLTQKINRVLNILFATFLLFVQAWSLSAGDNTLHYIFFSCIEIATLIYIMGVAITWKNNMDKKPLIST